MARLCPEGHKHYGMIAEALSNTGKLVDLGNASGSELVRRSDSRQQQGMGGADGTVAQDDFIGLDDEGLPPESTSTPVARLPSNSMRRTMQLPRMVRFKRCRARPR